MDLGSIFLLLTVIILVGAFISRPFFLKEKSKKSTLSTNERERQKSALLAEHERLLNALQELDFDFTLGKIPEGEYPNQREELLVSGAGVLRQLDTFQVSVPVKSAEDRLEAAIAARRADAGRYKRSAQVVQDSEQPADQKRDELEDLIQSRKQSHTEKAGGFCPRCGRPVQKSDQFCPKCGAKLA